MSTGNKKVYKKIKRNNETDKRMEDLEKEITRLENENTKLKRDSAAYESRMAGFGGTTRFSTQYPSLNHDVQSVTNKRTSLKREDPFEGSSHSKSNTNNGTRKKKLRMKLVRNPKAKAAKK
ncbi:unnamed protein product [Xylocopa violacea]|uniref:BZIP domain-containing protein n=1 Tax=Xylocopa violacea TaxID=135666 RepID=A0ABP1N021_XYLVO